MRGVSVTCVPVSEYLSMRVCGGVQLWDVYTYECVFVCVSLWVRCVYVSVRESVFVSACVCLCVNVCVYNYVMFVHARVRMCLCVSVHACVYVLARVCQYMCVCVYAWMCVWVWFVRKKEAAFFQNKPVNLFWLPKKKSFNLWRRKKSLFVVFVVLLLLLLFFVGFLSRSVCEKKRPHDLFKSKSIFKKLRFTDLSILFLFYN